MGHLLVITISGGDMNKEKYYSATEAAQFLGISKQTLIRYEKKKVFPKPKRNAVNGWREYTEEEIRKLKLILGRAA